MTSRDLVSNQRLLTKKNAGSDDFTGESIKYLKKNQQKTLQTLAKYRRGRYTSQNYTSQRKILSIQGKKKLYMYRHD